MGVEDNIEQGRGEAMHKAQLSVLLIHFTFSIMLVEFLAERMLEKILQSDINSRPIVILSDPLICHKTEL